jgi:C7-cyclitol 7-kinase
MGRLGRCLVFDIGGTSLRAAIYDPSSDSIGSLQVRPTPTTRTPEDESLSQLQTTLYMEMLGLAADVLQGRSPDLVSVAFPGPIDHAGNLLAAPTVWGKGPGHEIPLLLKVRTLWPSASVVVLNDVSAAGYWYLRDPKECFCVVTVSSGIGNKVFLDGRPIVGLRGHGGEIGHLRVDFSNEAAECDCGGRGHLGSIASGRGTLAVARTLATRNGVEFSSSLAASLCQGNADSLTNEMIVEGFRRGDEWSVNLIRATSCPLGWALAAIHHGLGVERFVIIGGFALALGEGYRMQLARAAAESGWSLGQDWDSMVELGTLGDRASLLGAGRYATTHREAIE